jgi:hypothetical protein
MGAFGLMFDFVVNENFEAQNTVRFVRKPLAPDIWPPRAPREKTLVAADLGMDPFRQPVLHPAAAVGNFQAS